MDKSGLMSNLGGRLLTLGACLLLACQGGCSAYRNQLGSRHAGPLSTDVEGLRQTDLACLLDPLGLGSSRVAAKVGSNVHFDNNCMTVPAPVDETAAAVTPAQRL